jgi:energy-coupling factor transport system permease protein
VIYARRASPLHACRPAVGIAWCAALATAALIIDHPLVLGALFVAMLAAGPAAGVSDRMAASARIAAPLALMFFVLNPFVSRNGLTVIARLGEVPWLGRLDLTLEATVYGGIIGLRTLVVVLAFGLYAATVDPDEVLRLFRRRGLRSALTVTVATRMAGVLERDARRLADGQRCRGELASGSGSRGALVRAVADGALDRALDIAAALELRGYGARGVGVRRASRAPWSRHDLAFLASTGAILALLAIGELGGATAFSAYPRLHGTDVATAAPIAAGLLACALAPFADRRGIER